MKKLTLNNIDNLVRKEDSILLSPYPDDSNIFILKEDLIIELSDESSFKLKKGFLYDGASVPYLLQWIFPKWGIYCIAALIHDSLYYTKIKSRKFADKEFKKWMIATKVKGLQIQPRYIFVVLFGWIVWLKGKWKPSKILISNLKHIEWTKKE